MTAFQSTRPVRGATQKVRDGDHLTGVSIHAPRAGRDILTPAYRRTRQVSIHAPRAGRDIANRSFVLRASRVSIHAPRAGRDPEAETWGGCSGVSIHAPRAGRDKLL
ncbi:hypothetical protein HMPREF9081_1891 [Centipeda periodontii DSM 2778]|uniref:Uncharacterized protein n=1 Tax=Centipeda periodontii DSM 2778 TaxID=888060 RepID=F5RNQ5_9FIRM|nr:hypothetical protein HMPREF9081_1891 [Centipeda periodontii DSM 2778]